MCIMFWPWRTRNILLCYLVKKALFYRAFHKLNMVKFSYGCIILICLVKGSKLILTCIQNFEQNLPWLFDGWSLERVLAILSFDFCCSFGWGRGRLRDLLLAWSAAALALEDPTRAKQNFELKFKVESKFYFKYDFKALFNPSSNSGLLLSMSHDVSCNMLC